MGDVASLYPPAPAGVPANLAKPGLHYFLQAVLVLLSLALFLLVHLTLLAGALALMAWVAWPAGDTAARPPATWTTRLGLVALHVSAFAVGAMLFAFLVKGFFKRGGEDTSPYQEVRESGQPELFQFIRSLCREIGAPMPARVYLRSPQDDRPATLLLRDEPAVREELTRQFYRTGLGLEPNKPLTEPERVEAFTATWNCRTWTNCSGTPPRRARAPSNSQPRWLRCTRMTSGHRWRSAAGAGRSSTSGTEFAPAAGGPTGTSWSSAGSAISFRTRPPCVRRCRPSWRRTAGAWRSLTDPSSPCTTGSPSAWGSGTSTGSATAFTWRCNVSIRRPGTRKASSKPCCNSCIPAKRCSWGTWLWWKTRLPAGVPVASLLPPESSFPDLNSAVTDLAVNTGRLAAAHRQWVAAVDKLNRIQVKSLRGILDLQEQLARAWDDAHPPAPVADSPGSGML